MSKLTGPKHELHTWEHSAGVFFFAGDRMGAQGTALATFLSFNRPVECGMTWIVGMPTLFGYSIGISDIRVTVNDHSEYDCLQKIYPAPVS